MVELGPATSGGSIHSEFFTNILVKIDEDVELGSMVEANIDEFGIGVEIPAEVEEYTFSLVGADVEDDLFNAG